MKELKEYLNRSQVKSALNFRKKHWRVIINEGNPCWEVPDGDNVDIDSKDILLLAIKDKHRVAIEWVMRKNPGMINEQVSRGLSPLAYAAKNGSLEAVKCLVGLGADVNAKTFSGIGFSVLTIAAKHGQFEVVQYLASIENIDIDVKTSFGITALMMAIGRKNFDIAKHLVERGADVTDALAYLEKRCQGHAGMEEMQKLLSRQLIAQAFRSINQDKELNEILESNKSQITKDVLTLGLAFRHNLSGVSNILLPRIPDDARATQNNFLLRNACEGGSKDIVKLLLENDKVTRKMCHSYHGALRKSLQLADPDIALMLEKVYQRQGKQITNAFSSRLRDMVTQEARQQQRPIARFVN